MRRRERASCRGLRSGRLRGSARQRSCAAREDASVDVPSGTASRPCYRDETARPVMPVFDFLKREKRDELRRRPFPPEWLAIMTGLDGPIVSERKVAMLGESWRQGVLVLAWDAARRGARDAEDGDNVILHEFAHQLDTEDGAANGAPYLNGRSQYAAWSRA